MLGNFATALSRVEIEYEGVDNIVNNLDRLGLIPWDKTQVHLYFTGAHFSKLYQSYLVFEPAFNPRFSLLHFIYISHSNTTQNVKYQWRWKAVSKIA